MDTNIIKPAVEGATFEDSNKSEPEKKKSVKRKKKQEPISDSIGTSTESHMEFDPTTIIDYASIIVYGARRIGKTHLVTWILSKIGKRFKEVHLFSNTATSQPDAWNCIDKDFKHATFNERAIRAIFDSQQDKIGAIQRRWEMNGKKGDVKELINKEVPHILLILDDIVSDPRVQRSGILNKVFTLGRHMRLTIILLSQNACASGSVSLQARGNLDYCIASMMNSQADWERLADYYFGQEGKRNGIELLKVLTEKPFHFAVAELHKQGRKKLTDYCSYVSAPESIPKFKLCEKDVWKNTKHKGVGVGSATKFKKRNPGYNGEGITKERLLRLLECSGKDMYMHETEVEKIYDVSSHMY